MTSLAFNNWALDKMANRADPDQMSHSVASDLGLHCLLGPDYPNTLGKYGKTKFE